MTLTIAALDRALERAGDDLYRLALLLTPDSKSASDALVQMARHLADAGSASLDEAGLIAALLAVLPAERRRRTPPPEWARPASAHAHMQPLLLTLARLPRQQRLVLGLSILRDFEPQQIAVLIGVDVRRVQELMRDALLALAPFVSDQMSAPREQHAADETDQRSLSVTDWTEAPEECRPTRMALALNSLTLHNDPAVRGHLALCAACRSIEQRWQRLTAVVEEVLRAALRGIQIPLEVIGCMQAALLPSTRLSQRRAASRWLWRALLPLAVVGLIAVLVWPRARPATVSLSGAAGPVAPNELVQRALDQLYAPPSTDVPNTSSIWHGRWQMRWDFADGTFALLNGDAWIDPESSRHRIQLVHAAGGGPFEFELADGRSDVFYAAAGSYGASLYPLTFDEHVARRQLKVAPADQGYLLRARLGSGAWRLARAYLRQAADAHDLRSWGRQQAADGMATEVVGFRGLSPLGLPPDAPDAPADPTTILLTIDSASGILREVRELNGPAGGEQVGRTTWRYLGGEWLTTVNQINPVFDLDQAWNGSGYFFPADGMLVSHELPLITSNTIRPMAQRLEQPLDWGWLPIKAPPGTTQALLVARPQFGRPLDDLAIFLGEDRRLVVYDWLRRGSRPSDWPQVPGEQLQQANRTITLWPGPIQRYQARVAYPLVTGQERAREIQLIAEGYTRAELLAVVDSLGPLTDEDYRAQASLFVNR